MSYNTYEYFYEYEITKNFSFCLLCLCLLMCFDIINRMNVKIRNLEEYTKLHCKEE